MPFFPPVALIRKNHIINKLRKYGACSEKNAKSFAEIGVINPCGFRRVTKILLKRGIVLKTEDGRFYLPR